MAEDEDKEDRPDFFWESEEYNPFDEIDRLQHRMNDMMRRMWEGMVSEGASVRGAFPMDVAQTDTEVVVRADLPGVDKDEVKIEATPTRLTVKAGKSREEREEGENYFRQERRAGVSRRSVSMPVEVDPEGAEAHMENGVLEIRLPKVREEGTREFQPE